MSNVDHPAHYGGENNPYEVMKVLRNWDLELAKGFCWGSIIKYEARAGKKGSALEDRQKAEWYATELVSIEAELAGRTKKGPSEIPVVINGAGSYRLVIDWENRTHKLITLAAGGGSSTQCNSPGGAGGSSAPVAGNSGFSPGGAIGGVVGSMIGGGAGGGAHWPEPVTACANLGGCHGGYHALRCPLHHPEVH